jgi:hypothetical protein
MTGTPLKWIQSAGGPLILIPTVARPRWRGTSGAPSDYDRACGVEGYVGVIEKDGDQVLVLNDAPFQTALARLDGRPCLVRWVHAPSLRDAESSLAAMAPAHLRGPLESVTIRLGSAPLVLMDAGASGEEPGDTLEWELEPGLYRVQVYEFSPEPDTRFLVHEFVGRAAS